MTKNGKKPPKRPMIGITIKDSFSDKIWLEKKRNDMINTNIIFGINEETVSPYREVMSKCLRWGCILSNLSLRIIIAAIRPMVKNQKVR